jgi:hypothetical protein
MLDNLRGEVWSVDSNDEKQRPDLDRTVNTWTPAYGTNPQSGRREFRGFFT